MVSRKMAVAALAVIFGISAHTFSPSLCHAEEETSSGTGRFEFSMDAGVEAWGGDVTYQIGYPVSDWSGTYYGYFPFSELTFPLDAVFGVVKAEAIFVDKYVVGLKVKNNISDPDDNMEDRDWITPSNPARLDIYSNSEVTDFSATVIDVDASYRFMRRGTFSLAAGIGYMYQDFEYETALIRQWSPSGLWGYDYVGNGSLSIIYEVESDIPYISFTGNFKPSPSVQINGRIAVAPWINVKDKDQHLLRDKVNTGDLDGSAVMVSLEGEYDITQSFYVTAGLDYTHIEADGDMNAYFYGLYDHTLAEEFESNQTSVFTTIGFRFGVPAQR